MTDNRQRVGDPRQVSLCGVPPRYGNRMPALSLFRRIIRLRKSTRQPELSSVCSSVAAETLCARRVSAQKRQITAVHETKRPRNNSVYPFAKRVVFPLDRGDSSRFGVKQDCCDLAARRVDR